MPISPLFSADVAVLLMEEQNAETTIAYITMNYARF